MRVLLVMPTPFENGRLGLENEVILGEWLAGPDYVRELGESHIFLLPSFRENAPITIMEAMLAGCVPIVAHASAQAETVDDKCGYRIPVTSPRRMAEEMAQVILMLDRHREVIEERGSLARERIASRYTETYYRTKMTEIYESVLSPACPAR